MIARTAEDWIRILSETYAGKLDEPLMLDWIDRHHAQGSLGRVVSKRRFKEIVDSTRDWVEDWPSTNCLHQTIRLAALP